MGSLGRLTILLTLGVWGVTTEGSPPDGDASSTTRPALAAPASEYLKGGIRLYNTGDPTLTTRYLKVANDYRDQLPAADQAQLDDYLAKLKPAPTDPSVTPAAATSLATAAAATGDSTTTRTPARTAAPTNRGTTDLKQEARWKLQSAKEQMRMGNYDDADKLVAQVRQMPVKWGLFDETPDKVAEAISKTRPKGAASSVATGSGAHDKGTAVAKLKEARRLLDSNQFEQAEAIALDVDSWGLSWGRFEDKPKKVADAARALRNRDQTRKLPVKNQPSQGVYDVLVAEARHLMATGQLDQAEIKARQAMKLNVVPSLTTDRAEAALNDIMAAKANSSTVETTPAAQPGTEAASIVAERQANEMLAKGQTAAAAAKLLEADRLKAQEMAIAPAAVAAGGMDVALRRVSHDEPGAPALDAPAPLAMDAPVPAVLPPGDTPPVLGQPGAAPEGLPIPSLSDQPADGNKGVELLSQAKTLFAAGNYPAAREKATEAKSGSYGVDSQADELLSQIALSDQAGALAVYESALDAIRKNDIGRARALLNEVAASGAALDEGMMQKVQDLLLKLPKDESGRAVAGNLPTSDAESLKAQQMNAEVGTKVAEARRLMETDPDKAIALLTTTLASIKAAELPQTVARTMVRRVEVSIELAKKDKVEFDKKMLVKDEKAKIEQKKLAILEADKAKKDAIKKLMDQAVEANAKGQYAKAEELARRAVEIDPNEIAATIMVTKANMQRHYETDKRNKAEKEEGFLEAMQTVDRAMIIDTKAMNNGISYPTSFTEMAERRKQMQMRDLRPKSSNELSIEKKLNEPITLNFKDTSLADAIQFIQNYTGLNVMLDPKALNDENLSRDSKVNIQANSIKLKSALKFMLRPMNLTYKAEDDVLLITSQQAYREKTVMWHYPVADLVVSPSKAQPLGTSINSLTTPIGVADQSGMNANSGGPVVKENQKVVSETDMLPLINLITNTIAPGSWRVTDMAGKSENAYGMGGAFGGGAGGDADAAQPGSITPFMLSISLIIRHTAEVHEEVAELLKQLRRLQDLQVSIEVRFITVSDDFFEQIGVDFDFNIQSDAVGKKTTFAAPNPAAALFPFNSNVNGGTTTGGGTGSTAGGTTTGGGTAGGTTAGGTGGGTTTSGTTGAGAGTTTGGGGGGGTAGGAGGISGGGFAGGGGGIGGAGIGGGTSGNTGGGTTGGGTAAGTAGTTGGVVQSYLVNPFLDHSLGNRTPIVVGTAAGGQRNFTSNLGIPLTQGSASQIAPFNGISTAGATFGISFLSDLEMYLFLTAAQGDARNNIVQAPKVTTFNGASATIINQQQQNYIQSLTPVVGAGAVAFTPQVGTLPDGVQLQVTPVVSADRRYVRLSLAPQFNTVDALTTLTFPAAAVGGGGFGGQATALNTTIQLPQVTFTTINTTVTVPDGGTVLLGGVKRLREQRLEYGVPVLAKTPLVNRLFRNIGIGRRTDSLMLMVTPRIIILEEEEQRLGVTTVNPNP